MTYYDYVLDRSTYIVQMIVVCRNLSKSGCTEKFACCFSDWLEVKMETDESPEPDRSTPESSPETSPPATHPAFILTPPSAFADLSSPQEIGPIPAAPHNHRTLSTSPYRGSTDTLWERGSPSILQGQDNPLTVLAEAALLSTPATSTDDRPSDAVSPGRSSVLVRPVSDSLFESSSTSRVTLTTTLQQGSPCNMATASMMNATFAVRSPTFPAVRSACDSSSPQRTPSILLTDSVMGTSGFAVQSPSSLFLQPASHCTPRTPSILATDSVMGTSGFAVQSPSYLFLQPASHCTQRTPSILATDSVMGTSSFAVRSPRSLSRQPVSNSMQRTPSIMATDSVMGNSTFAARSPSSTSLQPPSDSTQTTLSVTMVTDSETGRNPSFAAQSTASDSRQPAFSCTLQSTPSILVTNSVMGTSPMMTPTMSALQPESSSTHQMLTPAAPNASTGTSSLPGSPGPCSRSPLAERPEPVQLVEVTDVPAFDNTFENEHNCMAHVVSSWT